VRRSQSVEAQRDADLQEMVATTKLIGELSEKFWTKSAVELGPEDQMLRSHIMAAQHHLAEINSELFTGQIKWDCDVQLHKLMMAASGGAFGDDDREAEPGRLTEILIAANSVSRQVKKGRRKLPRSFMS